MGRCAYGVRSCCARRRPSSCLTKMLHLPAPSHRLGRGGDVSEGSTRAAPGGRDLGGQARARLLPQVRPVCSPGWLVAVGSCVPTTAAARVGACSGALPPRACWLHLLLSSLRPPSAVVRVAAELPPTTACSPCHSSPSHPPAAAWTGPRLSPPCRSASASEARRQAATLAWRKRPSKAQQRRQAAMAMACLPSSGGAAAQRSSSSSSSRSRSSSRMRQGERRRPAACA